MVIREAIGAEPSPGQGTRPGRKGVIPFLSGSLSHQDPYEEDKRSLWVTRNPWFCLRGQGQDMS